MIVVVVVVVRARAEGSESGDDFFCWWRDFRTGKQCVVFFPIVNSREDSIEDIAESGLRFVTMEVDSFSMVPVGNFKVACADHMVKRTFARVLIIEWVGEEYDRIL